MFNPKYRILLTSKYFPEDNVIGLGKQLISIINSLKSYVPPHLWYEADVEAVGKSIRKHNLNTAQLRCIGTDLEVISYCLEIEQFIWGVFLCIDNKFASQNVEDIALETEDKAFRSIEAEGVLIEIRAFDTSYFALYSEEEALMNKLAKLYGVTIDQIH